MRRGEKCQTTNEKGASGWNIARGIVIANGTGARTVPVGPVTMGATKSSMAILSHTAAIVTSWTQAGKATDDGRRRPAPGVRLTVGGLS